MNEDIKKMLNILLEEVDDLKMSRYGADANRFSVYDFTRIIEKVINRLDKEVK